MYLVTAEEMRAVDAGAVGMGIPALVLMENAGRAVAGQAACLLRPGGTAIVLAGPGQNGGDGFCAARHLSAMGFRVKVGFFGSGERLPAEAKVNFDALRSYPVQVFSSEDSPADAVLAELRELWSSEKGAVLIDALLGTGQKGGPRAPLDAAVRWANAGSAEGIPIVACDVPTGLDADTGRVFDPVIRAAVTVTMGLPKVGLYAYPGRMFAGRIVVETLGLPPELTATGFPAKAVFLEDARAAMPVRRADHHKGLSGHVTIIAGSKGMTGAAVLAAKAALRAGAGTATLLCPGEVYQVCASMVPEVMVLPCGTGAAFGPDERALKVAAEFVRRSSCVATGPGLGRGEEQVAFMRGVLAAASSAGVPCLIDADGLYALRELGGLSYLRGLEGSFILTPHPGELAHLMGVETGVVGEDRPSFARRAAAESGSVACLKGAGTCVANSSGDLRVNTSGDPAMATAGSGDVLSGVITALSSQGLAPFDAAWLGVFWHGLAGEMARQRMGSCGVLAGDISDLLPGARQAIEGR